MLPSFFYRIMTSEGSLISFAADNDKDATIYSAISANIWNTYKSRDSQLQYQILHCQVKFLFSFSLLLLFNSVFI